MLDATLAVLTTPGRNLPGPLDDGLRSLLLEPSDNVAVAAGTTTTAGVGSPQLLVDVVGDRIVDAWPVSEEAPPAADRDRRRLLVTRPDGDATSLPPRIVRAFAEAGLDVDGHRVTAHDHARYRTQKLILRLRPPAGGAPAIVVKLTRDPVDNHRLENEARALRELAGLSPSIPRLLAAGQLDGRSFVAVPEVTGPTLRAAGATAHDAYLDTVELTVQLAGATVHDPPAEAAPVLTLLLDRFVAAVGPPRRTERVLRADVERLAACAVPAVASHGDLGTWNVVLDPTHGAVVLDWEASERHGLPLWDLLYLHRSRVRDRVGTRTRLVDVVEDPVCGPTLRRAARRIVAATGTPTDVVPALFRLCWVHRAAKASTRRRRPQRRRGYAGAAQAATRLPDERILAGLLDEPSEV